MAAKLVTKEGRSLPSFQETSIARRISISLNTGAELVGMATAASGGPQKYWDIAKPLIAELCNQWRRTGSCASCAPETLCIYLREMYIAMLPEKPPLPPSSSPTDYAWTIEAYLNGYSSSSLALLDRRGIKRRSMGQRESDPRKLAAPRHGESADPCPASIEVSSHGHDPSHSSAIQPSRPQSPANEVPAPSRSALRSDKEVHNTAHEQGQGLDARNLEIDGTGCTGHANNTDESESEYSDEPVHDVEGSRWDNEGPPAAVWGESPSPGQERWQQSGAGATFDQMLLELGGDPNPFAGWPGGPAQDAEPLQALSGSTSPASPLPAAWQGLTLAPADLHVPPNSPDPLFVPAESPRGRHEREAAVRPEAPTPSEVAQADIDAMLDSLCLPRDLQRTVTGTIPCVTPVNPASDSPCAPPDASPMITKHQKGPLPPAGSATPRLASQPPDPPNISREEKVRQRWKSFQGRRGAEDLTATWKFVSRMLLKNAPMGWEEADRLMRMVFDIGSPATLVDVKEQLRQLRIKATTRPDWEARGTAGVFAAGCWHTTNEHASRVGLRLVYWCIHDHRHRLQQSGHRDPIAQTVNDIFSQLSCADRDRRLVEGKVKEWNKRAWPWNQLVHIAETPNIICFLPQGGIGYFSGEEGSCMTDYCKLTKAHFDAMDVIFKRHRSRFLDSVPPDFFEIFLYNRPPPHRFAIEDWADYEIFHEPLDSARFDRAFEPVQP